METQCEVPQSFPSLWPALPYDAVPKEKRNSCSHIYDDDDDDDDDGGLKLTALKVLSYLIDKCINPPGLGSQKSQNPGCSTGT